MGRVFVVLVALTVTLLAGCTRVSGAPVAAPSAIHTMSPAETAAADVKKSMQTKFDTDADFSKFALKVVDVVLVNKAGNEYKGIATVKTARGKTHEVSVDVTADDDNVLWETDPGAFLFALQEPPPLPPVAAAPPAAAGPHVLAPSRGGMVYIVTKSGKTFCQMSASEVDCQAPFTFDTPMVNGCPANGLRFLSSGSLEWICGDLGDIPVVTIGYGSYRALDWTIDASFAGTKFTHQDTGRSVFVSIDAVKTN